MLGSSALSERAIRGKKDSPHQMHIVRMLSVLWRPPQPLKSLSGLMRAGSATSHRFNHLLSSHSQSVVASTVSQTQPSTSSRAVTYLSMLSLSKSSQVSGVSTLILIWSKFHQVIRPATENTKE